MAGEADKTQVAASGSAPTDPQPKKKGSSKLILFGVIGLGVVAVGVALALFVLKPMMSHSSDKAEADGGKKSATERKVEVPKPKVHGHSEEAKSEGEAGASESLVYTVKDLVINPAGTNGSRFLSVSFGIELANPETQSLVEQRSSLVRDALITIMSSKTVAQLTDAREKEITRLQIKKRLSDLLKTSDLSAVYFTDFVLQ